MVQYCTHSIVQYCTGPRASLQVALQRQLEQLISAIVPVMAGENGAQCSGASGGYPSPVPWTSARRATLPQTFHAQRRGGKEAGMTMDQIHPR